MLLELMERVTEAKTFSGKDFEIVKGNIDEELAGLAVDAYAEGQHFISPKNLPGTGFVFKLKGKIYAVDTVKEKAYQVDVSETDGVYFVRAKPAL